MRKGGGMQKQGKILIGLIVTGLVVAPPAFGQPQAPTLNAYSDQAGRTQDRIVASPGPNVPPEQRTLPTARQDVSPSSQTSVNGGPEGPDANAATVPAADRESSRGAKGNGDDEPELPFTGLDLLLLGGAGSVMLLLGFAVRRLTRPPDFV
jgi:hypothetical protein